ncbi:hypothetical protein B9Z55_009839 [Caenorhabditis nigoni]|uniref:Uncharacterized protein n=1 Tax=Caenorhabditis nigoni TaxID=1611254 RepID=A0A2G5UU85_9PELO|nr:hypothetical protein B9Z55_009839 [Caenorhabditis nigoni]
MRTSLGSKRILQISAGPVSQDIGLQRQLPGLAIRKIGKAEYSERIFMVPMTMRLLGLPGSIGGFQCVRYVYFGCFSELRELSYFLLFFCVDFLLCPRRRSNYLAFQDGVIFNVSDVRNSGLKGCSSSAAPSQNLSWKHKCKTSQNYWKSSEKVDVTDQLMPRSLRLLQRT